MKDLLVRGFVIIHSLCIYIRWSIRCCPDYINKKYLTIKIDLVWKIVEYISRRRFAVSKRLRIKFSSGHISQQFTKVKLKLFIWIISPILSPTPYDALFARSVNSFWFLEHIIMRENKNYIFSITNQSLH